jgi:hypothetical protein
MKSNVEKKQSIAAAFVIGVTALLLAGPWGVVAGHDDHYGGFKLRRWRPCKPGGAYIGKDAGGATWSQTIVPCDPECNRMTGVVRFANINPVGPGVPLFPNTEYRTDFVSNMVRAGRNTWDFTWIGYGVQKPEDPQTYPGYAWPLTFIMVMSGTQTFTHGGKDVTVDFTSVKIWPVDLEADPPIDPDVDPADGFPDEGVEPLYSLVPPGEVYTETATRFPVVPPQCP